MSAQAAPAPQLSHDVADLSLAEQGKQRMDAALREMPVLQRLLRRFEKEQPLSGWRIAGCLALSAEAANLARVLMAGGAEVSLFADEPTTIEDDVAAALVQSFSVSVRARRGEDEQARATRVAAIASGSPQLVFDSGARLLAELHRDPDRLRGAVAATEDSSSGLRRIRHMLADQTLKLPVFAVAEAKCKRLFDQGHRMGQVTLSAIVRATQSLLAGQSLCVVGYGQRGRGIATRARGLGAHVIVSEVDPLRALAAKLEGSRVLPLVDAVQCADVVITATGDRHVLDELHFRLMKDRCVIANTGDFDEEINVAALEEQAITRAGRLPMVEYQIGDGKRVRLLEGGRSIHRSASGAQLAAALDVGLACHAVLLRHLAERAETPVPALHAMPVLLDREVAKLALNASGVAIDTLTPEQEQYLREAQLGC